MLEHVGARGTFYASAAEAGGESEMGPMFVAEDLVRLATAGHEIGCATFGRLDCRRIGADALQAEIVRNGDALGALGLDPRLRSFAWPFGGSSAAARRALPERYQCARGMAPGLAGGMADLTALRANAMYGVGALKRCLNLIERARRAKGWVIFYAHDVAPRPSPWGAPSGLLERLCGAAYSAGVRILPVADALALALEADEA